MTYRSTATHWLIVATLVATTCLLIPVIFAAAFLTKLMVVLGLSLTLIVLMALNAIKHNRWQLSFSSVSTALLGFAGTTALSIFLTQPYPTTNLFGLGGFILWSLVASWLIIQLLIPQAETAEDNSQLVGWGTRLQHQFLVGLGCGVVLLLVTTVLQQLGVGPGLWFNKLLGLNLPTDLRLSLAGSPLIAAQLGLITAVAWGILNWQQRRMSSISLVFIVSSLILSGLNIWAMLPGHPAAMAMPNWGAAYSIALDTLRSPRSALIGFGTDSYSTAYTNLRPVWLNGQATWQTIFSSANNWPLTLLVTQGLVSLVAWLLLVIAAAKFVRQTPSQLWPLATIVIVSFILQLALPMQIGVLVVQLLALACLISSNPSAVTSVKIKPRHWWPAMVGWLVLAGVVAVVWYYGQLTVAYYHLYEADRAAFKNDPAKLYDQQRQAVLASPYIDMVRRDFAITNLQLALALSTNKNATDADRAQITQLISQSIREAKAATVIDPTNSQNWVALAEIYRNLSAVTKDAGQWNVTALVSAVQTDPTNPILRLDLGQALADQNSMDQAVQSFNQAIELKPDLPSGYFQLGQILKSAGQLGNAKLLWQKTQSLLPPNTEDYRLVTSNLKDLDVLIAATQSGKRSTPTPTPSVSENASGSALLRLSKTQSSSLDGLVPANGQDSTSVVDHPSTQAQPANATPTP